MEKLIAEVTLTRNQALQFILLSTVGQQWCNNLKNNKERTFSTSDQPQKLWKLSSGHASYYTFALANV